MTIRNKLLGMAAVVLLAIAMMAGFTYYRGNSMMRDQVDKAGMEILRSASDNINGQFDKIEGVLRTAATFVQHAVTEFGVSDDIGLGKLAKILTERVKKDGIQDIYIGREEDGGISDGTGWTPTAGYDVRKRPWYKQAVAAGKDQIIFTDPFKSMVTGNTVILIATAINNMDGKLLGVVAGEMDIGALSDYIVNLKIFGKGNGALTLKSGVLVAYRIKEYVLTANMTKDEKFPEPLRNVAKKMVSGETGIDIYTDQGEEKQLFYTPTDNGFYLGILYPVSATTAIVNGLTTILMVIAVLAFLVTGLVLFFIVRSLTKSIGSVERVTEQLGAGDLTVTYDDSGKDEIAHISTVLNSMVASLREVMTSIRKESEETARRAETLASLSEESLSSMEEVSGSIEKVQDKMEQSSSALQETNASIEEIASGAQSAAKAAGDGAEGAAKSSEVAVSSVEEVDVVIDNIKNAADESTTGIERIKELAKSVEDISGFVTTITSIADQTNLLALNAAIEAARAGEAGRGFAVVAEEVRKLAEESARAAHEVNKLIDGLQRHSGDSITATETAGKILEATMKKASAMQTKLKNAISEIAKIAEAAQNIAAVSEEQAASSEEMTSAIQSVTEATGQVAESMTTIQTGAKETTKAAEAIATEAQDMAKTAENLQNLVARFKLDEASRNGLVAKK